MTGPVKVRSIKYGGEYDFDADAFDAFEIKVQDELSAHTGRDSLYYPWEKMVDDRCWFFVPNKRSNQVSSLVAHQNRKMKMNGENVYRYDYVTHWMVLTADGKWRDAEPDDSGDGRELNAVKGVKVFRRKWIAMRKARYSKMRSM